jgi:hypothetical protein
VIDHPVIVHPVRRYFEAVAAFLVAMVVTFVTRL